MSPPPALEPDMPTAQRLVEEIRRELEAIEQEIRRHPYLAALAWAVTVLVRIPPPARPVLAVAAALPNSGNYGIPWSSWPSERRSSCIKR
jgi:hypothetical protein